MIYIGLDDTDNLTSRGTGFMARQLAQELQTTYAVRGVTRHQLLSDPRVPMTAKNSCAALHLDPADDVDMKQLGDRVAAYVAERSAPGSDPGVCVARTIADPISAWGQRVQRELVTQDEAVFLAEQYDIYLRGLDGTRDGVIGALAAVGLAASGDDGRFIIIGTMRELAGLCSVQQILDAGIASVRTPDGQVILEGLIETGGKLRPALRGGEPVLFVEPHDTNYWPLKLD